ncbi:hypothetical protein U3516DRAFT_497609, partial [Neocallimastix sp. 'constans']
CRAFNSDKCKVFYDNPYNYCPTCSFVTNKMVMPEIEDRRLYAFQRALYCLGDEKGNTCPLVQYFLKLRNFNSFDQAFDLNCESPQCTQLAI